MSRRATLSAQLAQLNSNGPSYDPDASDNLDGLNSDKDAEEEQAKRKHYVDVGPSRLRGEMGMMAGNGGGRYGGEVRGRVKIFDDDDDDDDDDDGDDDEEKDMEEEEGDGEEDEGMDDEGEEVEEEGDEEDVEGGQGDDYDSQDSGGDEDDESQPDGGGDDDEEEGDEEEEEEAHPIPSTSSKTLDPIAALRSSRQKDILKGQAIRSQQSLFESLLTMRITYQKALTALSKLPEYPTEPNDEIKSARSEVLGSLAELSEGMFELRSNITLPGMDVVNLGLGKRKRTGEEDGEVEYWTGIAKDSLILNDAMREASLPILSKWSTKIQAATLSIGGKAAGSSKFLQGTNGQMGVIEAIEAGLANRRNPGPQSPLGIEEIHYRSLLREIIDTRTNSQSHLPDTSYRMEKKKKRDAERGGSKGRKIRYTIHEKAANFAVPTEIMGGWGEGQVDELFSSLLGGAGMGGGRSEGGGGGMEGMGGGLDGEGMSGLGGLRVF